MIKKKDSLTNPVEVRRIDARQTAHGTRCFCVKVHANAVRRKNEQSSIHSFPQYLSKS
jgi:hypothetical protein